MSQNTGRKPESQKPLKQPPPPELDESSFLPAVPPPPPPPLFEESTEPVKESFIFAMHDALSSRGLTISDATCYLYKYESYHGGDVKALISKYVEMEPPDENEIGRCFGSGRYLLIMTVDGSGGREKMTRTYKFRLHPFYDTLRAKDHGNNTLPEVGRRSAEQDMNGSFAIIERVMSIIIPLLRQNESPGYSRMVESNMQMMNSVMKRNMESQLDFMAEYQRKVAMLRDVEPTTVEDDVDDDDVEEPASGGGFMEVIKQIAPMLEEWLPKLVSGGPTGKAVSAVIKSTEMFQEIQKNQGMVRALIRYLDKEKGVEETDKVLTALKMKRIGKK